MNNRQPTSAMTNSCKDNDHDHDTLSDFDQTSDKNLRGGGNNNSNNSSNNLLTRDNTDNVLTLLDTVDEKNEAHHYVNPSPGYRAPEINLFSSPEMHSDDNIIGGNPIVSPLNGYIQLRKNDSAGETPMKPRELPAASRTHSQVASPQTGNINSNRSNSQKIKSQSQSQTQSQTNSEKTNHLSYSIYSTSKANPKMENIQAAVEERLDRNETGSCCALLPNSKSTSSMQQLKLARNVNCDYVNNIDDIVGVQQHRNEIGSNTSNKFCSPTTTIVTISDAKVTSWGIDDYAAVIKNVFGKNGKNLLSCQVVKSFNFFVVTLITIIILLRFIFEFVHAIYQYLLNDPFLNHNQNNDLSKN